MIIKIKSKFKMSFNLPSEEYKTDIIGILINDDEIKNVNITGLKSLQHYLEGNVEVYPYEKRFKGKLSVYVNEDGINENLKPNIIGEYILNCIGFNIFNFIHGNILLLGGFDKEGKDKSLNENYIELIHKLYEHKN
jgi:hypothetical protein